MPSHRPPPRITSYNVCYTKLLRPLHVGGGRLDGLHDVVVSGAAADVAFQPLADLAFIAILLAAGLLNFFAFFTKSNAVFSRAVFVSGLSVAIFGRLQGGGHVVSTALEHNSVLRPIAHCVDEHAARATLA